MEKSKFVSCDIYSVKILVYVGSPGGCNDFTGRHFNLDKNNKIAVVRETCDLGGAVNTISRIEDGSINSFIIFINDAACNNKFKQSFESILAHESYHLAVDILEYKGIDHGGVKNEQMAYMIQWVYETVFKLVAKWKKDNAKKKKRKPV